MLVGFVLLACGTAVPGERNQTHNSWMARSRTQLSRGNGAMDKETEMSPAARPMGRKRGNNEQISPIFDREG